MPPDRPGEPLAARLIEQDAEAERLWTSWLALCVALEQPVVEDEPGLPVAKDQYFWSRYPTDAFRGGDCSPDTTVVGLIDKAWRLYEHEPEHYVAAERELVAALAARLGVR